VATEWDAVAHVRGVSEGDMVRYALRKREPLLVELENFRDAVLGKTGAQIISLEDGIEVIRVAETILESAARGSTLEVSRA
jgi:UDP-N-acetylglucosamine 3-dehydrogenase